jgi:hypothetical protein
MYMLLQDEWPFDDLPDEEVADKVANGVRPSIDADIWNSTDPVNRVLKHVMIMCWAQEPLERKLDPGQLEEWGDA